MEDPLERSFQAVRPVLLFESGAQDCFSYTVKYDVPLAEPIRWNMRLLTSVPMRLSLIHPMEDFGRFRHDASR